VNTAQSSEGNGGPDLNFRLHIQEFIREQARPVEKFGHQPRLYRLATQIGCGSVYDDDVVFAAAWLHDLGVFVGHRPEQVEALAVWDNVRYAMQQAPSVLLRAGFPEEKIPAVLDSIRTHQPAANPETIEGILLRDADILEQLGSTGILRVVAKIGRDTRYSTFTDAVATLRKNLAQLPGKIRLDRAKEIAQPRITLLQLFLRELEDEAPGDLF
jgi:uncharacterized protein